MKCYILLAVTFTVAQALSHGFTNRPLANVGHLGLNQEPLGYSSQRLGLSGRRSFQETLHQESGNLYGGQRDGRFVTRDGGNNLRGIQYSVRPNSDYGYQRGDLYQQQHFRPTQEEQGFRYSGRNPQITFTSTLANTRSIHPRFDATGSQQSEYRFY